MQLACRQGPAAQQQWQQQAAADAAGDGAEDAARHVPPFREKPVVVLVGATLDEPLVQHAVEQVGAWAWLRAPRRAVALNQCLLPWPLALPACCRTLRHHSPTRP